MKKRYDPKTVGLDKYTFPKNKQWQIDQDYTDKLDEKTAEWLAKFNNEFVGAKVIKGDPAALHNTQELRRDCYRRSNVARRDMYAIKEAGGALEQFPEHEPDGDEWLESPEDAIIDWIDSKHSNKPE